MYTDEGNFAASQRGARLNKPHAAPHLTRSNYIHGQPEIAPTAGRPRLWSPTHFRVYLPFI